MCANTEKSQLSLKKNAVCDLMEPLRPVFELNKANIAAFMLCDEDRLASINNNLGLKGKDVDPTEHFDGTGNIP